MNRVLFFEFIADCVSVIILDYSHNRIEDVPVLVVTHQKKTHLQSGDLSVVLKLIAVGYLAADALCLG